MEMRMAEMSLIGVHADFRMSRQMFPSVYTVCACVREGVGGRVGQGRAG